VPLFYQHNINGDTKLGVWRIEEPENFFLKRVPLQRSISHPHKRLQHLAGRYLLQYLFPDFPYELIQIADTRKPFLSNEAYHFSISHCGDYAAVVVSRKSRVGVDIELIRPAIQKVRQKFLSKEEIGMLQISNTGLYPPLPITRLPKPLAAGKAGGDERRTPDTQLPTPDSRLLTLSWSAKEAMFKWFGEGGVDFRKHMQILAVNGDAEKGWLNCRFSKMMLKELFVEFRMFEELVLAWVITIEAES